MSKKFEYMDLFGDMPPMKHDKEDSNSDVLDYILIRLQANDESATLATAKVIFNRIRQPKIGVIFYLKEIGWVGCNNALVLRHRLTKVEAKLDRLEKLLKRATVIS